MRLSILVSLFALAMLLGGVDGALAGGDDNGGGGAPGHVAAPVESFGGQ